MAYERKQYQIGRGSVYFSLFKPGTQEIVGYRPLGNCPGFTLTSDIQTLDHFSSEEAIREKDESIILEINRAGTLTCDNMSTENVALFFLGTSETVTQTSTTAATYNITDAQPGMMYRIGATNAAPTGFRNLSNVVVEVAASTKVLGTDYTLDAARGLITFIGVEDGGTIVAGDDVEITYDRAASSRKQIGSGTKQVEGSLMFIAKSPIGTVQNDMILQSVRITPNGDFSIITESDWTSIGYSIEALTPDNGSPAVIIDGTPVIGS